jgi:hypothetical protein
MTDFSSVLSLESLVAIRDQLAVGIEEARAEMARLKANVSIMEERLQLVSRLIEVETRVESEDAGPMSGERSEANPEAAAPPRSPDDELETEVEGILEAAGKPMHISEIRSELLLRGFPIPGRGDDANIIVRLRKDGTRFVRTARGTYGLPKWGIPTIDRARSIKSKGRK